MHQVSKNNQKSFSYKLTITLFTCLKGRHCCLWCTIRNVQLKVPLSKRGRSPLRSLESLRDHQKFLDAGGDIKKAKEFNNVIGEAFFPIPLEKVHVTYSLQNGTNK